MDVGTEEQWIQDAHEAGIYDVRLLFQIVGKVDFGEESESGGKGFTDAIGGYDEEVRLLHEVRTMGRDIQEVEAILGEQKSISPEGVESAGRVHGLVRWFEEL